MTNYQHGIIDMARNARSAIPLLRSGRWTFDDYERWLTAVIDNDPKYLEHITSLPSQAVALDAPQTQSPSPSSGESP